MLDELSIRRIFREEVERLIPKLGAKPLLSIPDCIKRYGYHHAFYRDLIRRGEVESTYLERGKGGKGQHLIKLSSAERHPLLGASR